QLRTALRQHRRLHRRGQRTGRARPRLVLRRVPVFGAAAGTGGRARRHRPVAALGDRGRQAVPDAGGSARGRPRRGRADGRWPREAGVGAARAVHAGPAFEGAARAAAHQRLAGVDERAGEAGRMSDARNPQAEQMGDESMARNLAHQAEAIWPQEQRLFERYRLPERPRILDLGCGTGEITRRLAGRFPGATLLGVDILEANLARARSQGDAGGRIAYRAGDAFALDCPDAGFDLVVCRHMSQAVPGFPQVLADITRVLAPGGWLHLLSEDYGMLHFPASPGFDPDVFWNRNAIAYLDSVGCNGRVGRDTPALLAAAGYREIAMDYVVVDTLRVPRDTFAGILRAWRDGYVVPLANASGRDPAAVRADFDRMIAAVETPPAYACWHVPVAGARKPG